MPANRAYAPVFVLLAALACWPARADEISAGVAAIPGSVEDVRIGGTWDRDGESGVYRLILTRTGGDAVTARFFVQWVAYQEEGGAAVRDTIEIKELSELDIDIVDYSSESDAEGLSVFMQTLDPNGSADVDYELHVFSPQRYEFRPASN